MVEGLRELGFLGRSVDLRRSPIVAVALTARAHDCGPEPSLRTSPSSSSSRPSAFPSDSLGRIEVARRHAHPDDGLLSFWFVALLGCALVTSAAGPAEWRPRGRPYSAYAVVGVCAVFAFANVGESFASGPPRTFFGGERGGARPALPCACRPIARHRTGVQRVTVPRGMDDARQAIKKNLCNAAKRTPRRRLTTRKPPKAARAAGRGRAPQNLPPPKSSWREPQEP